MTTDDPASAPSPTAKHARGYPSAALVLASGIALALLLGVSAMFYFARGVAQAPQGVTKEVAQGVEKVLDSLGRLLKPDAWTEMTERVWIDTAGRSDLVVCEHTEEPTFTRSESWGGISDVVVSARVRCTFNYYVPMDRKLWHIEARKNAWGHVQVRVIAPPLTISRQKISSEIKETKTIDGSFFLSDRKATEKLLSTLMDLQLLPLAEKLRQSPGVREESRKQVNQFVRQWVLEKYADSPAAQDIEGADVVVVFADEPAGQLREKEGQLPRPGNSPAATGR